MSRSLLYGMLVVVLVVMVVVVVVCCTHRSNPNPTVDNMLIDASARIREELQRIPSTLITSKGRKKNDWGGGIPKEIMELHQQKTGWIQAWSTRNDSVNPDWLNFGLVIGGRNVGLNCELCPFTMSVLSRIKGLVTAGFSWLRPGALIGKHTDYLSDTNETVHLGLIVPSGECFLSVYEDDKTITTHEEENDKVIHFNSRKPHWAVNFSDTDRIILYLDIEKG
tara:strand:- start:86 stop:754 length:669 start_codon:yes stop_codon:yes gene_type:complete